MRLPFLPPLEPMLSAAADGLPEGEGWLFEPKWDGFRTLVFRDGDEIFLQSRDLKPMNRYFPSCSSRSPPPSRSAASSTARSSSSATDGLDFEALLLRIHPAESRVKMLAEQSPASFVAWDLLALGDEDLREAPLAKRARTRLEQRPGDARRRRCTSRPPRATARWPRTGSSASRAPVSTA